MRYAGIDFSLNGTALSISSTPITFDKTKIWFFSKVKKYNQSYSNITGLNIDYDCPIERNIKTVDIIIDILKKEKVEKIGIEGYSYAAAAGRVFDIAEGCGLLKVNVYKENIPFECIAPAAIKKFYTGKGNANKLKMYDSFFNKTNIDLVSILDITGKIEKSPVSDIVDSFAILEYIAKSA